MKSPCVTDGATRKHIDSGIFNQYKDRKYALRTIGKFIEFLSKLSHTLYFSFGQAINFMNPRRYCFHDIGLCVY